VRIGIGALVGIRGGPATYAHELVAALSRLGGHRYVVFTDRPEDFASLDVERVHVPLPTTYHQVLWDHGRLPGLIAAQRVGLYHGTKNILPWRLSVPGVVTVHDLAVYACPETFAWPQRLHSQLCVPLAVPLALAVPPAPAAIDALRSRHGLGEHLVACVGTIQPRKRVEHVIDAFGRARGAERGWELIIAGRLRPGYQPAWLHALPAGVRWLGALGDADLSALYAAAAIAMSASEYEGFGLTVLEAMAAGCAVVAVGVTSVPEVAGDAALLVARSDPILLGDTLARLLDDPAARASLGERARQRAATFSWEETARRTRDVYDEVLG